MSKAHIGGGLARALVLARRLVFVASQARGLPGSGYAATREIIVYKPGSGAKRRVELALAAGLLLRSGGGFDENSIESMAAFFVV